MKKISEKDYIHGGTQKDYYEDNEKEYINCPLCAQNDYQKLDSERGLSVVRCKECKLIFTNPRAINAQENYFGDANVFYEEARLIFNGKKKHHRDRNYKYELKKIKKIKKRGKLLDVGTNMGFFLRKAKEFGYETEGVEPSPSLSKIAREAWNLKVHNSFIEDVDLAVNSYDIITLIDVFEHVIDPKKMLNKVNTLLKKDGIVAIKVPNGDYNFFKMKLAKLTAKKESMDIWNSCEHVVHYTPQTFKKMITACGFKLKKTFIPIPVHPPIWANLVGHYYQYPSPYILDWKRILLRRMFYVLGKIGYFFKGKTKFGPDLMFIIEKK